MLDLIIKNGIVVTMAGGKAGIIEKGSVGIKGNRIVCVDDSALIAKQYSAKREIDAEGKFILPGFINVHTHSAGGIGKGILTGLRYYLEQGIAGYNESISDETMIASSKMHVLEGIKRGYTTYCDNNFGMSKVAFVLDQFGVRGRISDNIREMPWDYRNMLGDIYQFDRKYAEPNIKATFELLDKYGTDPEERISVMVSFQALDYNSEELVIEMRELAKKRKAMIHTHLAQSPFEVIQCEKRYGLRPVAALEKLGMLNSNTIGAHLVYNTPEENKIAAQSGLRMAYCPNSFTRAGGIPPAAQYVAAGGIVGTGSDECAYSCVSPFADMRSGLIRANIGARIAEVPAVKIFKIFQMSTIDAAKAVGLEDQIGSIEPNKKADIVIFDPNVINMTPVLISPLVNIIPNMILAATGNEVETVIIDGKIVMEDRKVLTADEKSVIAEAQTQAQKAAEKAYAYYKKLPHSEVLELQADYGIS